MPRRCRARNRRARCPRPGAPAQPVRRQHRSKAPFIGDKRGGVTGFDHDFGGAGPNPTGDLDRLRERPRRHRHDQEVLHVDGAACVGAAGDDVDAIGIGRSGASPRAVSGAGRRRARAYFGSSRALLLRRSAGLPGARFAQWPSWWSFRRQRWGGVADVDILLTVEVRLPGAVVPDQTQRLPGANPGAFGEGGSGPGR